MDDTMRSYLTDCMQRQVPASFDGYNKYVQSAINNNKQLTLSAKAGSIALKGLAIAGSMLAMWAITKGIELLVKGIDHLVHKQEYAMDAVRESHDEFSKLVSDLQAINEEIKTTSQRIEELQKLKDAGTISLADEDELRLLREKNDELDRQRILREQEKADAAKKGLKNLKDADLTVTSKYKYDKNYDPNDKFQQAHGAGKKYETVDIFEEQQLAIDDYNKKLKEKNKLLADGHELTSEEVKKVEEIDTELKSTQDYISDLFNDDAKEKLSYYRELIEGGNDLDDVFTMSNGLTQKEDYENLVKMEEQLILIAYRTRKSADAFKLLNEETKRSELASGLEAKGIKEDLAKKVVDSIRSDELDNYWDLDFKFKLPDINDYDGDIEKWAKDLASLWANSVRDAMESEDISPKLSFEESMSSVQSLSKGLDQLEKVFNDVRDKESFDWSSIFNNEDFKSTFGSYKEEYEDFLKTVSNSPDNIDNCKNAFNNLVVAYINNSDAIKNLNEENKEAAILFLQQKGISNAKEIVSQKLRQNEEKELISKKFLTKATKSLTDMTVDEIDEFAEENKQLGITASKIKAFALEKKYANGIGLNTASDISNLKSLVEAIGGVTTALGILEKLKNGERLPGIGGAEGYKTIVENAKAEIQSALDSVYDPPRIEYNPPNTDKKDSSSKTKETKSTIDWIQRKLEVLQNVIDSTKEKFQNLFSLDSQKNNLKKQIEEITDLIKAQKNAANTYQKLANKAGKKLSKSLREKVDNGDYSIEDYSSETQDKINNYKDLSEKANDANNSVQGLRAQLRDIVSQIINLPYDKAQEKINKYRKSIDLLSKKLENASSTTKRASIIKSMMKKERNALTELRDAVYNKSGVKTSGKKVNTELDKDKSLSKKEKKTIKDLIKDGKKISLKGVKKDSTLYNEIVEYNLRVDAKKEKIQELKEATEDYISTLKNLAQQLANIPWEESQKKIEKNQKWISLYQARMNNAISSKDKNKWVDEQIRQQSFILKHTKEAYDEEQANLKKDKSDVKNALKKDSSLTKKQKNLIEESMKNGKKISQDILDKIDANSDLYKAIENYNAQLETTKDHAIDLEVATEDYISTLNELNKMKFDNIQHEYENMLGIFDSKNNAIQDMMNLAQARGQQIGEAFYTNQIDNANQSIALMQEEREKLLEAMKDLAIGSDAWYEARQAIYSLDSQISQAELSVEEFNKAIRDLDYSRFEQLQKLLENITKESSFLINLMADEDMYGDYSDMSTDALSIIDGNGIKFSEYGLATMGQRAMNYDVLMAQADRYAEKIRELDAQYANDQNNTEYLEKRQEYLEAQQSSITSAESEKKAIIDLVRNGFQSQINALKEAVDEKKKQLQLDKEAYEFNKKISEQKKSIADIQKQINALEGDDSEENRKKLQELRASLKDAEEALSDSMYDKSISDQEKALDNMLEDAEKSVDEYMKDSNKIFTEAINLVNSNSQTIGKTIESVARNVGYTISHNITDAWKDGGNAVTTYATGFATAVSGEGGIVSQINLIAEAWEKACAAFDEYAKAETEHRNNQEDKVDSTGMSEDEVKEIVKLSNDAIDFIEKHLVKAHHDRDYYGALDQEIYDKYDGKVLTTEDEKKLANMLNIDTTKSGWAKATLDWLKKYGAFSTGGYIDAKTVRQRTGEDGIALVKHGEAILTVEQSKMFSQLVKELPTLTKIPNYVNTLKMPNIAQGGNVYNIESNVNVDGVATNEIVKNLESIATKQAENVVTKINRTAYGKGTRK